MNILDRYRKLFTADLIDGLHAAKEPWLNSVKTTGDTYMASLNGQAIMPAVIASPTLASVIAHRMEAKDDGAHDLLELFSIWKIMHEGHHVVRPNLEQCKFLAETDVNVPLEDYAQPFPVTVIEFDEETQQHLRSEELNMTPDYVMCYHEKSADIIVFFILVKEVTRFTFNTRVNLGRDGMTNIEDILTHYCEAPNDQVNQQEVDFQKGIRRIALNLMLLATNSNMSVGFRDDQKLFSKLQKQMRDQSPKFKRARKQYKEFPMTYTIEQQMPIVSDGLESQDRGGTHASPKTHWRRAHWKGQRYGPNNSKMKRILIARTFVNPTHFAGNKGDTVTTFK